ncbi:MAG: flavin reductase family protein [Actinomycetia bacterium]|nr:flavin reductase family protein [Actinomycetes bacterium]
MAAMELTADAFRAVMSRFVTGVCVVTVCDEDGRPRGLTVNAFTSVSLQPPTVLVSLAHASETHPVVVRRGMFAVNILAADQHDHARKLATKDPDKFHHVGWSQGPHGVPLLHDALAHLVCRTQQRVTVADHDLLIATVVDASVNPGSPLIFYDRRFWALQDLSNIS